MLIRLQHCTWSDKILTLSEKLDVYITFSEATIKKVIQRDITKKANR